MSRKTIVGALISACFVFFVLLFLFKIKNEMKDFKVNYTAGKRLRSAETLYRLEDEHYMFKYLTSSALLYIPLSLLPLGEAKAVWYALIILSSGLFIYLSYKYIPEKKIKPSYLLVFPPLILAKFFLREIQLGQINAFISAILLLMFGFLASKKKAAASNKEFAAGLLWGLGMALKPYAAIFFPYFLVKKKWKVLYGGIGFLILALLSPSLYYGFHGNRVVLQEWMSTFAHSTPSLLTSQDNISIWAFFAKWTNSPGLSLVLSVSAALAVALLFLGIVWLGKDVASSSQLECASLLILTPLISPLGWDYTLLMCVFGVMILLNEFFSFPAVWRVILVAVLMTMCLSLYDLMGKAFYAKFMSWSVLTICALVIFGYLASLRFRKVC